MFMWKRLIERFREYREPDYLPHASWREASTGTLDLLKNMVGMVGKNDTEILNKWKSQLQDEFDDVIEKVEKNYSNENNFDNIVGSYMIWGCQYDQMLIWMQRNGINVVSTTPIEGASLYIK